MKTSIIKLIKCFLICGLALLLCKPMFFYASNPASATTQYTQTTECPTRAAINAVCQSSAYYTAIENELGFMPYLFIGLGLLFFTLTRFSSCTPIERPFKPPI